MKTVFFLLPILVAILQSNVVLAKKPPADDAMCYLERFGYFTMFPAFLSCIGGSVVCQAMVPVVLGVGAGAAYTLLPATATTTVVVPTATVAGKYIGGAWLIMGSRP